MQNDDATSTPDSGGSPAVLCSPTLDALEKRHVSEFAEWLHARSPTKSREIANRMDATWIEILAERTRLEEAEIATAMKEAQTMPDDPERLQRIQARLTPENESTLPPKGAQ